MRNKRSGGKLPWLGASGAKQAAWQFFPVLALLVAGCTAGGPFQAPPDGMRAPNVDVAGSNEKTKPNEEPAAPEKPAKHNPKTFPEALCAYWKCLHLPRSERDAAAKKESANSTENHKEEDSQSKSGEDAGKKSPPAAGPEAEKQKNQASGENSKQGNADKDKENGEAKKPANGEKNGKDEEKAKEPEPSWYSAHAQATMVTQVHDKFHSPYIGPNSLQPVEPQATSLTSTLFLDFRLWQCGGHSTELVFNPELAGGRGLSNVTGIAGFPNGEITRVGAVEPTPYFARLFVRQTCGLGGEQEKVEDDANQIAGMRDINRITLLVGKMAASDLVDNNIYSHDPRTQFLPWSIMFNGAWDYPANVRGYTYGVAIDYNTKYWALRYGIFAEPTEANGAALDPKIDDANGQVLEYEQRYWWCNHPGHLRLLAYLNHAHMGKYSEALAEMPVDPNVTQTRAYRFKYGFGLSWDQGLTKDLGIFTRLGWNDGHTESWAFTAIDRLFDIGLLLKGTAWCRPNDTVGLALGINGLEKTHHDYLAAGGLDFIIGDGKLHYGPENILETFYDLAVIKGMFVTSDFQEVFNPAYNRDRGPVFIASLRVHIEF